MQALHPCHLHYSFLQIRLQQFYIYLGTQGIFDTSKIFGGESLLSKGLFNSFELHLRPIFDKIGAQISGLLKK